VPHYGLALIRGDREERTDMLTETHLAVGDVFERAGEWWLVEDVEQAELGRFTAWLVCSPAEPDVLH
jgi:hypothetical protein